MSVVTVGERYQIVIPKKERRALHIKPHSRMNVVAEGSSLKIYDISSPSLKGIGKTIADGTDATNYVKSLRQEWRKND
ncbi:MAG: AbrB/MazE/SpoVT family DNA-binding domain-containing protein [Victivallales bacterium]